MIIGGSKAEVIENIKIAAENKNYNSVVELNDPTLTDKQSDEIVYGYVKNRNKTSFKVKSVIANLIANIMTAVVNKDTEIIGIEKLKAIKGGAIITCNHFNPLDNTLARFAAQKTGRKNLYTVAKETNFAMEGFLGFIMNYANTVPISRNIRYTSNEFSKIVEEHLGNGDLVLIYPEQEMWFNYRKPRPLKPGAYHYAAKNNVPVIGLFAELTDTQKSDGDEFFKVKYRIHVLDPIYPDKNKTFRENSRIMQEKDLMQRKKLYEKVYNKKADSEFSLDDIAGWKAK